MVFTVIFFQLFFTFEHLITNCWKNSIDEALQDNVTTLQNKSQILRELFRTPVKGVISLTWGESEGG